MAHSELCDGVIDDIECVAPDEVEGYLDDECRTVNHSGLDDQDEDLGVAELR